MMSKDHKYSEYAYMTFDDIRDAFEVDDPKDGENNILIAIKAPIGTKIEIPDPS